MSLHGALAEKGLSLRSAALAVGVSKSTLGRHLLTDDMPLSLLEAVLKLVDDPAVAWQNCPAVFGWPAYLHMDAHPAACLLDAEQSAKDFLDAIDGRPNPSAWTDEQRDALRQMGNNLIRDVRRLLDSLRH